MPQLLEENGLTHCVCYYLRNAHCRRVQSLSCLYATSTPHIRTHDDGIRVYHTSIASRDKSTLNSNLANIYSKKASSTSYHPSAIKVICEEPQRMDSPISCATNCVMPTADESNHSAAGTLHPHQSAACFLYVILRCPILLKNCSFPLGAMHPTGKNHPLDHLTHHPKQHNWCIH